MCDVRSASGLIRVVLSLVLALGAVPLSPAALAADAGRPAFRGRAYGGGASLPGAPKGPYSRAREARRVNVRWARGVPAAQRRAAQEILGFKVVRSSRQLGWTSVAPTRKGDTPERLAERLRAARLVRDAEVEKVYAASAPVYPDDPLFPGQWALHNAGVPTGTPDADIDAPEAWGSGTGSQGVIVAVVDTGIDVDHPDLKANIWRNRNEIPGNGRDDDRNGCVDDVRGYDFANEDGTVYDPEDGDQHGTHVAGIIGAKGDNATGIAGVNWDVTIMPVKALGPWGGGDYECAAAVVYAVDNGAQVVNCSWGGTEYSRVLLAAFDYAAARGVLCVAAAGNWGANIDRDPHYPASFDSTAVIAVAATDDDDSLAWWSNYGADSVDIAAPGVDVTSTLPYDPVGVYVDKLPYRVMYLGACVEAIEPSATRSALVARSLQKLGASTSTPLLLVDDSRPKVTGEVSGARVSVWEEALAAGGYTDYQVWETETSGTPPAAGMRGRAVVWFTGAYSAGWFGDLTLERSERDALGSYLDAGGRLLLSSGDLGLDTWIDWESWLWYAEYLRCMFWHYDTWGYLFKGAAGTPFEGLEGGLDGRYTNWWDQEWPWPCGSDHLLPLDRYATTMLYIGGYGELSGTSMSAPHVAGAAALLKSQMPTLTAEEIRARIENRAHPLPGLVSKTAYEARLDLEDVTRPYPGRPRILQPRNDRVFRAGEDVQVRWAVPPGGTADGFEVEFGTPYDVTALGFESGTLDGFTTSGGASWVVTAAPFVHSGSFAARSGIIEHDGVSSLQTTVTVPPEGGRVDFWYLYEAEPWWPWAYLEVDGAWSGWYVDQPCGWTKASVGLSPGEHVLRWTYDKLPFTTTVGMDGIILDDISVVSRDFDPAGTVSGACEITWTVPALDTDEGVLRVRGTQGSEMSSWAYSRGLRISTDVVPPGRATDVTVTPDGDGGMTVSWANPSDPDFDSVRVLSRVGTEPAGLTDASATVSYEGTSTGFTQGPFRDGEVVHYAVWAFDESGNDSGPARARATASDVTPPSPVSLLDARLMTFMAGWDDEDLFGDEEDRSPASVRMDEPPVEWLEPEETKAVAVSWMNPMGSFETVRVLRRVDRGPESAADPNARLVYEGPAAFALDYELLEQPFEGTAHYGVWTQDLSGLLSEARQTSIAVDTLPPKGEFRLADGARYVPTATVQAQSRVAGATEMRFDHGEGWGDWRPYSHVATLTLLPIDGPQVMRAQYRDASGNVLDLEDDVYVDLLAPEKPTGLKAYNWNSRVRLSWNATDTDQVAGYDVFRSMSQDGAYSKVNKQLVEREEHMASGMMPAVTYWFKIRAKDHVGRYSPMSDPTSATPGTGVVRLSGRDRYRTAVEASKAHWDRSSTVVLATGEKWVDAMTAAGLAGSCDAPVLLTRSGRLPAPVLTEMRRLGAWRVIVVGGRRAVSDTVVASLPETWTVQRIQGRNRYETAANVAREVVRREGASFNLEVVVVGGEASADAAAAAPVAFSRKMPVLLVEPDSVPAATREFLDEVKPGRALVLGGTSIVSRSVTRSLRIPCTRIAGRDRYATAAALAERAAGEGWADLEVVGVCNGAAWSDAVAGGAAVGRAGGVMLYTRADRLPGCTADFVLFNGASIGKLELFGSVLAVRPAVEDELITLMMIDLDFGGLGPGFPFGELKPGTPFL